jgi:ABC-type nitrate/sulfonate/bicarbonate transport system permease component
MKGSSADRAIAIASPLVFLAAWEVAAAMHAIDVRILPPPSAVAQTIYTLTAEQNLASDIGLTVTRFLVGTLLGVIPGVFLGISMGLSHWVRAGLYPLLALFYTVPRIALFPLVLILVGLNESSNLIMVALGPFFTMLITSMGAVMNIDPIYRDVARNFGARPKHLYRLVMLPAIAPALMDGLRLSVGLGLLGTVAVEFLVSDGGIGHLIWNSWQVLSLKQSMAGIVVAAAIGFIFYVAVDLLERLLIPWQKPSTFA